MRISCVNHGLAKPVGYEHGWGKTRGDGRNSENPYKLYFLERLVFLFNYRFGSLKDSEIMKGLFWHRDYTPNMWAILLINKSLQRLFFFWSDLVKVFFSRPKNFNESFLGFKRMLGNKKRTLDIWWSHPPKLRWGLVRSLFRVLYPKNPDPSRSNRIEGSNSILRIGM